MTKVTSYVIVCTSNHAQCDNIYHCLIYSNRIVLCYFSSIKSCKCTCKCTYTCMHLHLYVYLYLYVIHMYTHCFNIFFFKMTRRGSLWDTGITDIQTNIQLRFKQCWPGGIIYVDRSVSRATLRGWLVMQLLMLLRNYHEKCNRMEKIVFIQRPLKGGHVKEYFNRSHGMEHLLQCRCPRSSAMSLLGQQEGIQSEVPAAVLHSAHPPWQSSESMLNIEKNTIF